MLAPKNAPRVARARVSRVPGSYVTFGIATGYTATLILRSHCCGCADRVLAGRLLAVGDEEQNLVAAAFRMEGAGRTCYAVVERCPVVRVETDPLKRLLEDVGRCREAGQLERLRADREHSDTIARRLVCHEASRDTDGGPKRAAVHRLGVVDSENERVGAAHVAGVQEWNALAVLVQARGCVAHARKDDAHGERGERSRVDPDTHRDVRTCRSRAARTGTPRTRSFRLHGGERTSGSAGRQAPAHLLIMNHSSCFRSRGAGSASVPRLRLARWTRGRTSIGPQVSTGGSRSRLPTRCLRSPRQAASRSWGAFSTARTPSSTSWLRSGWSSRPCPTSLRVLREHSLVKVERRGRKGFYALYDEHVVALLEEALRHVEHRSQVRRRLRRPRAAKAAGE